MRKKSQNWFAFSTDENSETLESSAINDGRSMLAMFLTVLYKVEGLETEIFCSKLVDHIKKTNTFMSYTSIIGLSFLCYYVFETFMLTLHETSPQNDMKFLYVDQCIS